MNVTPFYKRIHWAQIKKVILIAMRVKSSFYSKRVGGPDSRIHTLSVALHVPVSTGFTMTCDKNNKTLRINYLTISLLMSSNRPKKQKILIIPI